MPKKSLSSLELAAVINELQFLKNGKISQIYHPEKKELILQLHARGEGKCLLKIIPGKFLCLTKEKEKTLRPSGFCMQLRKYISNAFIKDLFQKDSERIAVFELEKKEKYYLIVELFSKGNVILTDHKHDIIGTLEQQTWKDRIVRNKEKYVFPASRVNWKKITEKEFEKILKKSEKKNLATSLATELGLGGVYAEEICKVNNIDFKKLPKETDEKEVKTIIKTIKDFIKDIERPSGYIYDEQITPMPLLEEKVNRKTKTYNEAVNTMQPFEKNSPYEKKIAALKRTISEQEQAIENQEKKIELNKKKGELVYEKYAPLQKLLDAVKELRKSKDWIDVEKELKKEKKIRNVDLKNKKVLVDL